MTDTLPATLPRCLQAHARVRGARPAYREKHLGVWQSWSWAEAAAEVRALACGLAAQGFGRGMRLAIIGDNRPRLYWAMLAAQAVGGVPVPLYQDAPAEDMRHVLEDAQIVHAIVEDQEQVDKLLALRAHCPGLLHIAYEDGRGLRRYADPGLVPYTRLQDQGRAFDAASPGWYDAQVAAGAPQDPAIILYTSGTTGKPKGVVQTHAALLAAARGAIAFDHLSAHDNVLSYLPMAWVGDCLFSLAQALAAGFTVNCPESAATVLADMREIGPTFFFAPPRVFENLLTTVTIRMQDAGRLQRALYDYFLVVAGRSGAAIANGAPVPLAERLRYALGELLVYGPLKNVLGMARIRVAYTAGAAIGPDLFRFYRALGINLKQLYGSTETCAYVCLQADGDIRVDSVGRAAPGVELKLAANGEVLVRSPALMTGYYRRPEATAAAIDADGYFHTGDAGLLAADGHLKIIDRAADVGRMRGGALFAPNYIENKLKFSPYIREAVAFGADRDQVCCFLNLDPAAVGDWAERRGIACSSYADLAAHPGVIALLRGVVEQVNAELAADPALAPTQVRRFLVLHKELDPDDEELTRTRKVRRGFIAAKYAPLVEALFAGRAHQHIETAMRFEDGRRGTVSAELRIEDAATFPALEGAA